MLEPISIFIVFLIVLALIGVKTPPLPSIQTQRATPAPERVRKLAIGVRTWLPTDDAETLDELCRALGLDVPPLPPKRLLPANPVRQDDED